MWRGNQIKNIGERTSNPSHVPSQINLHAKKRFRIKGLCLPSESSGNSRVVSSPAECAIPQKSAKIYFEVRRRRRRSHKNVFSPVLTQRKLKFGDWRRFPRRHAAQLCFHCLGPKKCLLLLLLSSSFFSVLHSGGREAEWDCFITQEGHPPTYSEDWLPFSRKK